MARSSISDNEQRTLFGLTRFPTFNDRELSEKLDIKMSTVTAIKNRLKKRGLFEIVRIPILHRLGCEVLSVCYARINPLKDHSKMVKTMRKVIGDVPECVWAATDPSNFLAITISETYTDVRKQVERVLIDFIEKEIIEEDSLDMVHYPFAQNNFFRYFDYSPLLDWSFDLGFTDKSANIDTDLDRAGTRKLSKIEKKTLLGLVKYPDLLDNKVAKKIGVTRQSVTKMKKRFRGDGVLRTLKIPNVAELGFDILLYIKPRFNPKMKSVDKKWKDKILQAYDMSRWVFISSSDLEASLLVMGKNYREIQKNIATAVGTYKKMDFLREYPEIKFFSLQDTVVLKNHVYAPLLEKLFYKNDEE